MTSVDLLVKPLEGLSGELRPQPSKFYTQLAACLAALAEGKSTLESPLNVRDTVSALKGVEALGAEVRRTRDKWVIWGVGLNLKPKGVIDVKNSATSLAALAPLASLAARVTVLTGDAQLRARRMVALLSAFRRLGLDIHSTKPDGSPPFVVFGGGLKGGKIEFHKSASLIHVPFLILPCPYAQKKVELCWSRALSSPQLELTAELVKTAGVELRISRRKIVIPRQPYQPFEAQVPSELSSVAPFIVTALMTDSRLKIPLKETSARDRVFLEAVKRFGAEITHTRKGFTVSGPQSLRGAKIDLSKAPELLPFLAVLASKARGKSVLKGAKEARFMKSDRISAMAQELRRMGVRVAEQGDGLVIKGGAEFKPGQLNGHEDYAVVAALVAAGLLATGEVRIRNKAEALQTSYSRFVSRFRELGAEISYLRSS